MAKLKLREFGMTMHMKLDHGHSYVYTGYIDQPGHPMDGKRFFKKLWSPKKGHGEPDIEYSLEDGTPEPPKFKKLVFLMDNYGLKPMEE